MRRLLLPLLIGLLILTATAHAQQSVTFETHPNHSGLICFLNADGWHFGNCGNAGAGAAGRGVLNFALWGLNGECRNPTWGGSEIGGPRAVTRGTRRGGVLRAEGPMPYYIQSGQISNFGAGHTPCTSGVDGAGAYLWYEAASSGNLITVNWRARIDDVPANGCINMEVTAYSDGFNQLGVWSDHAIHFQDWAFEQPEAARVGFESGAPLAIGNPEHGLLLSVPGAFKHEAFWYAYASLGKVAGVTQHCGLVPGTEISGTAFLAVGRWENAGAAYNQVGG